MRKVLLLLLMLLAVSAAAVIITPEVVIIDQTADLQAAVDATPAGGTLRLGVGEFTAPAGGLILAHSIAIIGESQPSDFDATYADSTDLRMGTVLVPYEHGDPVIVLDPDLSYSGAGQLSVRLENLVIDGTDTERTVGGFGIYSLRRDGIVAGEKMMYTSLKNVTVVHTGDTGIYLGRDSSGSNLDRAIVGLYLDRVNVRTAFGYGLFAEDVTVASLRDCHFQNCSYYGAYLKYVGATFDNCAFESNARDSVAGAYYDAQLYALECNRLRVLNSHFENFDGAPRNGVSYVGRKGIFLNNCPNLLIEGNLFTNGAWDGMTPALPVRWYSYPDPATNVAVGMVSCDNYSIGTNKFERCYYGIRVNPSGSDESFRPGRVENQQTYDYYGYGCLRVFDNAPGSRFVVMDTTYTLKYPPQGEASGYPAGGTAFFDTNGVAAGGDGKLVIWTGTRWMTVDMTAYVRATP